MMETAETTNGKLNLALSEIDTLIEWADADYQQSLESDAPGQARYDFRRATNLRKAKELLQECRR